MPDQFLWDVFLSHSRQDKPRVRRLAERLRDAGLRVWFDEWTIKLGTDIYAAIEDGLEGSRTLVLCMSRAAFSSEWVRLERGTAIFRDPENKARRFVPLLLEDCPVRDTIRRFAYVDWRAESDEALASLIEACREVEPAAEPAAAEPGGLVVEKIAELPGHQGPLVSIAVTSDSRRALTASHDDTLRLWDLEGGKCLHVLSGHEGDVNACAIGPDDRWAVSGAEDASLRVWDLATGKCIKVLKSPGGRVRSVAILPGGLHVLSGDYDHNLRLWSIETGECIQVLKGCKSVVTSVAVARDDRTAVSGSWDKTVGIWDLQTGTRLAELTGHTNNVYAVAISPNGQFALSGSSDSTVRLWDLAKQRCLAVFEGHSEWVVSVAFSPDGQMGLSNTTPDGDGARLWRIPTGECLSHIQDAYNGAAFTPDGTHLLTGGRNRTLAIWRLRAPAPDKRKSQVVIPAAPKSVRYTNAKVVLLGESGVGKSGLANRLIADHYEHTESTHGMRVEQVTLPIRSEDGMEREVWLWDLAGQEDYRLIHQLFLDETAVALVVTNPQADDPFAQIGDWLKALRTALKYAPHEPVRLLIAARTDVGGMKVSNEKIERFLQEHGFADYLATSAKTGENCSDSESGGRASALKELIARCIPWDQLPFIATDRLLRELKNAVLARAARPDAAIVRFSELCQQMGSAFPDDLIEPADVRKAVRLLGNQGVILPLDFGDLILLRPAELNNYAAAVIRAARNHTDQIGSVPERRVLEAKFDLTGVERLEPADEALLLRAMVQTFLDRSLCLAEETTDGRQLIFPSQFRRDRPMTNFPETIVTYTFGSELPTVFTTLVVRLWYSRAFDHKEIWQNAAEFLTPGGAMIGFVLAKIGEGTGQISVFAEPATSDDQKVVFIEFVHQHLLKNAVDLVRERRYVCANLKCGKPVTDAAAVRARLEAGKTFIVCHYCDKKVPLIDVIERRAASDAVARKVREMDETATTQLQHRAGEQILYGHLEAICGEANQLFRKFAGTDGIDGEVEFKGNDGNASGKKIYVQLKSGDAFLRHRQRDDRLIFDVQNARHLDYWQEQPCDVYLVIRASDGEIRWMNLTTYLKTRPNKQSRQIEFTGERLDAFTLMRMRDKLIPLRPQ